MRQERLLAPTVWQRLVGLFVLWQVVFIVVTNCLELVPRKIRPQVSLFEKWSDLTGQRQGWGFFTPHAPRQSAFLKVELRWPDRVEELYSQFEPADPYRYFQPLLVSDRLYNVEWKIAILQEYWTEERLAANPEIWRQYMAWAIRLGGNAVHSYLHLRLRHFQSAHPEMPAPQQVILYTRLYEMPPPGSEPWVCPTPVERPIVSWQPGATAAGGRWPLQLYDPSTGKFEVLPDAESP
jgi:hypothetical protein